MYHFKYYFLIYYDILNSMTKQIHFWQKNKKKKIKSDLKEKHCQGNIFLSKIHT